MGMTRLVVHIDKLVLSGLPPEDRHAVAAALEQELALQLGPHMADAQLAARIASRGDVARLAPAPLRMGPGMSASALGRQVARDIARSLKP
ncbi:hypothetical protein QTI66_08680 [Variovorax sp. J22R133]|uniref:hypothetical protein n=1 Tax=Variovorax brevis TaxID=3053503 RepID=UPI00257499EF|nr:hypothetical protein [Variovorax sp. J22R133]MDM0112223.1 hypothetical protein [Variovorax sp. J22R133]